MGKLIYLDNAATTKTSPDCCRGHASVFYRILRKPIQRLRVIGTKSKEAINKSRETIAATLGAKAGGDLLYRRRF